MLSATSMRRCAVLPIARPCFSTETGPRQKLAQVFNCFAYSPTGGVPVLMRGVIGTGLLGALLERGAKPGDVVAIDLIS